MINSNAVCFTLEPEMNELTKRLLSEGVYEVKFVSSSATMSVFFLRIKFPYLNSFKIIDF